MTDLTYTDRDGTTHTVKTSDEWTNYGDVHPQAHGGLFVRWTGRSWDLIATRPPAALPDGITETEHMVEEAAVWPDDLFIDGDPDQGPTDFLQDRIDELYGTESYVQVVVEETLGYYVAEYLRYYGGHDTDMVPDDEYQEYLQARGIDL